MMLAVQGIKKVFYHEDGLGIKAVDDVTLTVSSGENLAIVGESGCGKTTLARIVMGLVKPDEGAVVYEGQKVWGQKQQEQAFRRRARMVFQDPFTSLDPRFSVRRLLKEALCLEPRLSQADEAHRMKKCLVSVGLSPDVLVRYPHEFSGGERQRIAIARALMTDPELLILDEAVSSLDVLIQKEVLELLMQLQKDRNMTYLFISHNLRAVRKISQKIAVMYRGKIVECGLNQQIFKNPKHAYTRRLLTAAFDYRVSHGEPIELSESGSLVDSGDGHFVLAG